MSDVSAILPERLPRAPKATASARPSVPRLHEHDLELHAQLGIGPELLAEAGVRRVDDREARERLGGNHRGDLSGVLYPRRHPLNGHELGYRVRRDHPELETGQRENKYLSSVDR